LSVEEGWQRGFPLVRLSPAEATHLLREPVHDIHVLSGGLRNSNYRVELASGQAVLRLYTAEAAACQRETRLLPLLSASVPVPLVLQADCTANPPWALFEYVGGVRFDHQPAEHLQPACFDAGRVLARIHRFPLARTVGIDLNRYSAPGFGFVDFIESTLANGVLARHLGGERTKLLRRIIREYEARVVAQDTTLQHSDYKPWNLLACEGRVAAVLDWEFAFAGPRLNDIANFLRYSDRQPPGYRTEFVRGYLEGGGTLPDDWFRLARLGDLMSLCEMMGRHTADSAATRDIVPLVERTIDLFTS